MICSRIYVFLRPEILSMKFIVYSLLFFLILSCSEAKTGTTKQVKKSDYSKVKKHEQIELVQRTYQSKIDSWKEYENLLEFLNQYYSISPNDAINNSRELNDITKSLNDSIKPEFLETPAFNARANLLFNETLRLYDMSSIPAIKAAEVNEQVAKVLDAFSAINSKINTFSKQAELDNKITDLNFKNKVSNKRLKLDPKSSKVKRSAKSQKMNLFKKKRLKEKQKGFRKRKKDVKKDTN